MTPVLTDALLDAEIETSPSLRAKTLREALGPGPTVLLFVRHFG